MEININLFDSKYISAEFISLLSKFLTSDREIKYFNKNCLVIWDRTISENGIGVVTKKDENGNFELTQTVSYDPKRLQQIDCDSPNFIIECCYIGDQVDEIELEINKLSDTMDISYRGVLNLINYLYEINPNQFTNHLKSITPKMLARRKIDELASNPKDPKEIHRFYQSIKLFNYLEKIEKIKLNNKDIEKIDYDKIYVDASNKYHISSSNLKSILQAKKRSIRTCETKLKK